MYILQTTMDEITKIELKDEIDLHAFHPSDAKPLLREFIENAKAKGFQRIRIVHGKGRSVIKGIVISELKKNSSISDFHDEGGNWGATIAYLKDDEER